jgi:hypothetical protein
VFRQYVFLAGLIALGAGCVSQSRMLRNAYIPQGEMRVLPGSPEEVAEAAQQAGFKLGLRQVADNGDKGFRLMETGAGLYTWGSYVSISARQLPSGRTALWIEEKLALSSTALAIKSTDAIFSKTAANLGMTDLIVDVSWAPTSPETAMAGSALATLSGVGLLSANVALWVHQGPQQPVPLALMTVAACLLTLWGPGFADAMNGDWERFGWGGLVRLAMLHPMFAWLSGLGSFGLSFLSVFGAGAGMVMDVLDAKDAPKRWAQRRTSQLLREAASDEENEAARLLR